MRSFHIPDAVQSSRIIEWVPTKRTAAGIAGLEPLVQTERMERILARAAALVGQLPVGADDGVADSAFGLALERAGHVAPEGDEAVN